MLKGKKILLGVTGGIAAYKAAALTSKLTQQGADVHVIMTASAQKFITELTLQTLSRNPVYTDTFDERKAEVVSHIHLADIADMVLIAPATANMIGKMAHGLADDMLSTTLLATTAPVMIAPAMNVHMYTHPAVIDNMRTLAARGVMMIEPGNGQLACGYVGKGRLEEPETIVDIVERYFMEKDKPVCPQLLRGRKVIVTAGGTVERLDPVRYITNDSSGKMGFAIAKVAGLMGADVQVIAGNTSAALPEGVAVERIGSAQEMYEAVMRHWEDCNLLIMAAAVADYRPREEAALKLKKQGDTLQLELVKTVDILETLGQRKTGQFLVGFAAETDQLDRYARGKLVRKNCDLLVANDVTLAGAGFGTDTNAVHIYDRNGLVEQLPVMGKDEVACRLLTVAASRMSRV